MASNLNRHRPVKVFCSYSPKDEDLRKSLQDHLAILRYRNIITYWHDGQIIPGAERDKESSHRFESADVILLLISASFLSSQYPEVERAVARHDAGKACVIPVLLRPVDSRDAPFSKLQMLPTPSEAVTLWPDQDKALESVARGIRDVVTQLQQEISTISEPDETPEPETPEPKTSKFETPEPKTSKFETPEPKTSKPETLEPKTPIQGDHNLLGAELEDNDFPLDSLRENLHIRRLYDFLEAKKWQEADQETLNLILNRTTISRQYSLVRASEIESFDCLLLHQIDCLWVRFSNGRFGFSVQSRIWHSIGGPLRTFNYTIFPGFGMKVGWHSREDWLPYANFIFDSTAPAGHFPSLRSLEAEQQQLYWWQAWETLFKGFLARQECCASLRSND